MDFLRPPSDEGDAVSAFPNAEFGAEEFAVDGVSEFGGGAAAEVEHAAVITGDKDKGVVGNAALFEAFHDLADDPVEFVNEVAVDAGLACALKTLSGSEGVVDIGGGEEAEEGFFVAGLDPLGGFFGEGGADFVVVEAFVGFDGAFEAVRAALSFLGFDGRDGGDVFFAPADVDDRVVGVAADDAVVFDINVRRGAVHDGHAEVVVETEVLRSGAEGFFPIVFALLETEVPFAEDGGVVSALFEKVGDGEGFGGDEEGRGDGSGAPEAFAIGSAEGVFAGEEPVAGRSADGGGRVGVGKAFSFGGQPVDVGGFEFGGAVAAEIAVAEIVGEDEDDVGAV